MFKNSSEIFDYIKKNDVKLIDVRFIDLPGIQHHFNVPVESLMRAYLKMDSCLMALRLEAFNQFMNQI